jgi:hypothetical protein
VASLEAPALAGQATIDALCETPGQSVPTRPVPTVSTQTLKCGTAGKPVLVLFSGPRCPNSNSGAFAAALCKFSVSCSEYDTCNGPSQDVADDAVWLPLLALLQADHFDGMVAFPPGTTFSKERGTQGNLPVLRSAVGKSRYGLPNLTVAQKAQVRLHNLLAVRAAEAFRIVTSFGRVACLCGAAHRASAVSLFNLDEYVHLTIAWSPHLGVGTVFISRTIL